MNEEPNDLMEALEDELYGSLENDLLAEEWEEWSESLEKNDG